MQLMYFLCDIFRSIQNKGVWIHKLRMLAAYGGLPVVVQHRIVASLLHTHQLPAEKGKQCTNSLLKSQCLINKTSYSILCSLVLIISPNFQASHPCKISSPSCSSSRNYMSVLFKMDSPNPPWSEQGHVEVMHSSTDVLWDLTAFWWQKLVSECPIEIPN